MLTMMVSYFQLDRFEGKKRTSTHLLSQHDDTGSLCRTTKTGDGEEFNESSEHVAGLGETGRLEKCILIDKLGVDKVQIASSLERSISKFEQGLVCFGDSSLLQQPTRRFGTEPDAEDKWNGRNECRPELKTPSNVTDIGKDKIGARSEEDAESGPDLPRHDETTANIGRRGFCRVHRNSDFLQAHANAKKDTAGCDLSPGLGKSLAKRCEQTEDGSNEDGSSTTEVVVDGVGNPGSAARVRRRPIRG